MAHLVKASARTLLMDHRRGGLAVTALAMLLMTACGGGDSVNAPPPARPTVTVSGTVSYEFVPPNGSCTTLNFGATVTRPIRGATVQLIDTGTGAQIASMASGADGSYSFSNVPRNTSVQLRVRAELKDGGSAGWDVDVRDNFVAGGSDGGVFPPAGLFTRALFVLDGCSFDTGVIDVTRDLTATTGGGVNDFSGPRAAAPFAILDAIYTGMQFVRSADATRSFPELDVFWSVNNTPSDNIDITAGEVGTSSYYSGLRMIIVLGDAAKDIDEFDDHVVLHEWGHYFEDVFSRSDSPGGTHSLGESLDASLAFSEGWGTAFAAMALDDPIYCETRIPGVSGGFGFSIETVSAGVKGWFNELSVMTLLYDLWDTDNDGSDNGSIGFGPIYNIMTGPQAATEGITTLFSFASELRSSINAQGVALLDSQLNRENVVSGAALDIWATNETNFAGVPTIIPRNVAETVLPLYTDYTADGSVQEVCVDSYLDGLDRHGNNIGEDRYLRITVPADDQYDVSVVTTTATPPSADPNDRDQSDPDIYIIRGANPSEINEGISPVDNSETYRTPMMFADETYAAIVEDWRFDDPGASDDYPPRICFDVSLTPTP
jgi:hypothetical protein